MKKCFAFIAAILAGSSVYLSAQSPTATLPKLKASDALPANLFVELAKNVNPAVVNIFTTYTPKNQFFNGQLPDNDPFFQMIAPFMVPQQAAPQQSLGSGFIIREDGLIVTNNHVIDKADVIKVQITERTKESFNAKLIGKDSKTDIALIKIEAKRKVPFVKLGSSADVQVGEWVAAFGNPYGYGHSMTKGIISAIGRELDDLNSFPFMQTDASINPGNSGGPLVNTQGEVIGVNAAIDSRAQGIGFVIPIDVAKSVIPQLEKNGTIERGFIGINLADLDEENAKSLNIKQTEGALVTQVMPGTPGEKAGLQPYDLIVDYDGKAVTTSGDLIRDVLVTPVGKKVALKVIRNSKPKNISVTIGSSNDMKAAMNRTPHHGGNTLIAPYNMGFAVADFSKAVASQFGLPALRQPRPVIVDVDPNGAAARAQLAPGDVILDVNRREVVHASDVIKALRKGTINIFRVLKRDHVVLISVRAS